MKPYQARLNEKEIVAIMQTNLTEFAEIASKLQLLFSKHQLTIANNLMTDKSFAAYVVNNSIDVFSFERVKFKQYLTSKAGMPYKTSIHALHSINDLLEVIQTVQNIHADAELLKTLNIVKLLNEAFTSLATEIAIRQIRVKFPNFFTIAYRANKNKYAIKCVRYIKTNYYKLRISRLWKQLSLSLLNK